MDKISVGYALLISLFSIIFVFALLYIISLVISLISIICKKSNNSPETKGFKSVNTSDDEIVAVITAAVSMYNDGREVNIKSIKDNSTGLWIKNSRIENLK